MEPVKFSGLTSLDVTKLVGVTDLSLWSCAPACLEQLPAGLETLSLHYGELPNPLRLDQLTGLKSLSLSPPSHPRHGAIAIEALPSSLEKLDLSSCVVERLPDTLPPLKELSFHSSDLRAVPWARLPASLESLSVFRCELPTPLPLPALPSVRSASFHATNLRDARQLLSSPKLEFVSLGLTPLDDDSLAALMALGKTGVNIMDAKRAQFELTRQLYAMGVNLSAEKQPRKKIRLHHPMMSVAEDFPHDDVMALAQRTQHGEAKFVGQAFIDELSRQRSAARKAQREAKKAAKKAAT